MSREKKTTKQIQKLAYKKPKLTCYGKIKSLTMGTTGGAGESGMLRTHMIP